MSGFLLGVCRALRRGDCSADQGSLGMLDMSTYAYKILHNLILMSTVRRDGGRLERAVADAVVAALGQDPGDVLVGGDRSSDSNRRAGSA